ncbi:MAG: glycosyltransferase family 2 protein [Clostridiales bacterium]|nr:glycosyltransferase family 2 protein [Clostridiales bacterium]
MPKISIIMLTYNREQFVERAIESILLQTFKDFELILVNNGSTDNSGSICDKFSKIDSRIKVIHKEKGNIASGRNAGLEIAQGEYIGFVDDDDYALPEMFEILYNNAIKYDADISLCGSYQEIKGERLPRFIFEGLEILDTENAVVELLKREKYNVGTPTKLFKRYIFEKNNFLTDKKYDDVNVVYKFFVSAKKVVACGEPLYVVNRHESNNSNFTRNNAWDEERLSEYIKAYEDRTEYLINKLPNIADYVIYTKWSYFISMCNKIKNYKLKDCENLYKYMKQCLLDNFEALYSSKYVTEEERYLIDEILNTN